MKAAALRGALSDRARNDRVHVLTALIDTEAPSTKVARKAVANLVESRKALVARRTATNSASCRCATSPRCTCSPSTS